MQPLLINIKLTQVKYHFLFIIGLLGCPYLYGQYIYTLKATGFPVNLNNKRVYMEIYDGYSSNRYKFTDTTTIKDGHIFFSGNIRQPSEDCKITIAGLSQEFNFVLDSGVNLIQVVCSNNRGNKTNNHCRFVFPNSIANKLRAALDRISGSGAIEPKDIAFARYKARLELLQKYPDCFYSLIELYLLLKLASFSLDVSYIDNVFQKLSPSIQHSQLGREMADKLAAIKNVFVGNKIPAFETNNHLGQIFHSNDLRGKFILLAFGATWCGPCKKNYPKLKQWYNQYKAKGFEIVQVNLDTAAIKWQQQIKEFGLPWVHISELVPWKQSVIANIFYVPYVPTYFLINREGAITYNPYQLKDPDGILLEKQLKEEFEKDKGQ